MSDSVRHNLIPYGEAIKPAMSWRGLGRASVMKELLRTSNAVYLSYAQAMLADAGIQSVVFDTHMSIMEGSIGALPRRLMVDDDDFMRAKRVLAESMPEA